VRELRNLMERLTVTVHDELIEASDLPDVYRPLEVARPSVEIPLGSTLAAVEELVIRRTLAEVTTHREKAAKILGISPRALHYKIGRYGLRREDEDGHDDRDGDAAGHEPR
jgi:DNA-binding NtrC family response regulator